MSKPPEPTRNHGRRQDEDITARCPEYAAPLLSARAKVAERTGGHGVPYKRLELLFEIAWRRQLKREGGS